MTSHQQAALEAAFVALGVVSGSIRPVDAAIRLSSIASDLVPVEDLKEFLIERDRIWADLSVDIAETAKVGPEKL